MFNPGILICIPSERLMKSGKEIELRMTDIMQVLESMTKVRGFRRDFVHKVDSLAL